VAEPKTKPTELSVDEFIANIEDPQKRADVEAIAEIMAKATRSPGKMWGTSIVGYGEYHYVYESGREGDWFQVGFSPRKRDLTLYIMDGFGEYEELLDELGKHKTGKSCLYINKLADVDVKVLTKLVRESVKHINEKYKAKPKAAKKAKAK
jgi:hypothetical protein